MSSLITKLKAMKMISSHINTKLQLYQVIWQQLKKKQRNKKRKKKKLKDKR